MKTAAALSLILLLALLFLARRPLLRGYLAVRDVLTDAPLTDAEAWVYRKVEGD